MTRPLLIPQLSRLVHGVSILGATLAVLIHWPPPASGHTHRPSNNGDGPTPSTTTDDVAVAATMVLEGNDALTLAAMIDTVEVEGVLDEFEVSETAAATEVWPGMNIVDLAIPLLGTRYIWGGTTPAGFDCSGFVYYVLAQAGHAVPRDHGGQLRAGERVSQAELEPGDMVFFRDTYMAGLSHGGIYVGEGKFIHASTPNTGVILTSLGDPYWATRWVGATRIAA